MSTPGERLRNWRKENNLTLKEMADILEISQPSLTQFETNKSALSMRHLIAINQKFGISIDWLLTGTTVDISEKYIGLIEIFDRLTSSQQKQLIQIAQTFIS